MIKKFKIFESIREQEILYTLKTKAKTTSGDKVYEYDVVFYKGEYDDEYGGLVLSIETTPGSWYLSTLLENDNIRYQDEISISGSDWMCDNWKDVISEVFEILPTLEILISAKKYNI
jgi:hypothetical protein